MLKVFVIDIVWVILMNILMYLDKDYVIAHKLHFFDGSNGIQSGISAAFKTIFVVYGVPIIFTIICFFIWMKNKHPKALIYVLGGILLAVIAGILIFHVGGYRKKKLYTPEYLAAASKHYNEYCDGQNDYEKSHYTALDEVKALYDSLVDEYADSVVSEAKKAALDGDFDRASELITAAKQNIGNDNEKLKNIESKIQEYTPVYLFDMSLFNYEGEKPSIAVSTVWNDYYSSHTVDNTHTDRSRIEVKDSAGNRDKYS